MQNNSRGYLACELAVVIAVVTVVVAMGLPMLSSARESARVSRCQMNLHRLAVAFTQYSCDYGGDFPRACAAGEKGLGEKPLAWDRAIFSYVKNPAFFICPSDTTGGSRSYSLNDQTECVPDRSSGGIRAGNISEPAVYVLLTENHSVKNNSFCSNCASRTAPHTGVHKGSSGSNIMFFDGHISFERSGQPPLDRWQYLGPPPSG